MTYLEIMTKKFRFWLPVGLETLQSYIKSSPRTFILVVISRKSAKGAKNSYGDHPTEFVTEIQKSIASIKDQIIQ
jgi:hypothetical protein